jgi:3-oxoadipate enol-lactonase
MNEMQSLTPNEAGTVRAAGGELHYEYFGTRERPPVVVFNAVNQTARSWHQHLAGIAAWTDVLLWDYPGVGDSPRWDRTPTFEELAEGLHAITQELGLTGPSLRLLAICFGSGPALEFLRRHRAQVEKVVLSGALLTWEEAYANQRQFDRKLLAPGRHDEALEHFFAYSFSARFQQAIDADPEHKAALFRKIKATANEMTEHLLGAQVAYLQGVERYYPDFAALDVPVRLIAGEQDMVTPTYVQRKLLHLLPNASYTEYPGAGHLLYVEEGTRFFTDALTFLLS